MMSTTRILLVISLVTFGLSARAETCADAYKQASDTYLSKLHRETGWTAGANATGIFGGLATYVGCSAATGGWGIVGCIIPAGAVIYLSAGEPRRAYLESELQIHMVNFIYEQSQQESTAGSQEVHALAEATGWPESEVLGEVARHMQAGDLCQDGKPSVGYDELVARLKR